MKYAYVSLIALCLISMCCWGAQKQERRQDPNEVTVQCAGETIVTGDGKIYTATKVGVWKDKEGNIYFLHVPNMAKSYSCMIVKKHD